LRIGLFTELKDGAPRSREATLQALADNRPHDVTIEHYSTPPNLAGLRAIREILKRTTVDRLDLVHVATSGPLAVAALILAARSRLPMILSCEPPAPCASAVWKSYVRTLAHYSFRVLVTSVAARNAFLRTGVCASKLVDWRPGVETSEFLPSKRSSAIRGRWGVTDARPAVIYAGALSSDRGAGRLLSLELGLRRTRPMHQLIVVGDGPCRREVEARCPNVIFTGVIPHAEMPAVLASADLYVCPSDAVSTNLAVLEAQASGLPVVVMENGSARERVGSSAGVVCRSSADFIVETAGIVRTDARRKVMSIAAREYAMRQDWSYGLMAVYAEYRAAAAMSAVRRDLEPAFVPQSRRL
jgi:glycosyltransferase involved in cell wall biosynthesis